MFGLDHNQIVKHYDLDRAMKLHDSGKFTEALEMAQRFSARHSDLALAHIFESGIAEKAGSHVAVLAACQRAITLAPDRMDLYFRGIMAALHLNDESSATRFFAAATPIALDTGKDLEQLWTLYQFAGQAFQPPPPPQKQLAPLPSTPLVSIVIATAGRPHLLPHALNSLLGQTYGNWEAIVVNARPEPIKLPSADPRIQLLESGAHLNAAQARNLGLDKINGQLFCILDDDDIFKPHHLSMAIANVRGKHVVGVFSDSDMVMERVEGSERTDLQRTAGQAGRAYFPYMMEMRNYINFNEPVFRRDCCGHLRFDTDLSLWEDWDFMLAAFAIGPFDRVHQSTCEVRRRLGDQQGHMSFQRHGSAAACEHIFANHPASRPWIELGRQVFKKVQQVS